MPDPAYDIGAVRAELMPTGRLRIAIAVGPVPSAVFAVAKGDDRFAGVPVDLGLGLARALDANHMVLPFESSGVIQSAALKDRWDVSFMPVDAIRREIVNFSNPYHLAESTYLVAENAPIASVAEANSDGIRIVGLLGTATCRSSERNAPLATHIGAASVAEAIAMLRRGEAHALALGRDALRGASLEVPGSRVLDDAYFNSSTGIAIRKGRSAALAFVNDFIEREKANGGVRRAFDAAGLMHARLAPAGPGDQDSQ